MPGYTEVFGGSVIYPSQTTYLPLNISTDVQLSWPLEQQTDSTGGDIVADIMDITASGPGLNIDLPDARQATQGFTALFNNVGAETVTIRSATGATIISLVSGSAWQIYLTDNSTESGTWRTFQYGASVSVANAAALAGSGLKAISTTLNQSMPVTGTSTTPTAIVNADRAKVMMWEGGAGSFTLPDPATVGNDWYVNVRNSGSGDLTITPAAGQIDGGSSKVVSAGAGFIFFTDGSNYYSIGGSGSSGGGGFDYVSIDAAGSGDLTLSGVQLNRIGYNFTGILTGTRNIIVPNAIQEYWVTNSTTEAFSLFVKTAAQMPGIEVLQGDSIILACDGTNVYNANSTTVSFPIPITQGGTGGITASAARTNLGATAVGSNLFTTASAAAARSTLGSTVTGDALFTAVDAAAGRTTLGALATTFLGIGSLTDPNADRMMFWDDSAGALAWLTPSTGLAISGTNLSLSFLGLQTLTDPNADRVMFWDDSAGSLAWLSVSTGLSISGTTLTATVAAGSDNIGYLNVPQNAQTGNYVLVLADAGKHIYHSSAAGAGDTYTIPANASVAFAIGTMVMFVNQSASTVAIAITSDTMTLAGTTSTGTRTLAQNGVATAMKVSSTGWLIWGVNLT